MAEKQDQGSGVGDQGSGDQTQQGQGEGQGKEQQGQQQGQQPAPVPYARFKAVNDQLAALKQQLAAQQQQQPAQQQQQQSTDLDLAQRLAALEQDLANERVNMLRLKVARSAGLPDELAGRLTGANEEELAADAAKLVPLLKPKTPGVPPPPRGGSAQTLDLSTMTAAQIREARVKGQIK
jgi:hypothetical protein